MDYFELKIPPLPDRLEQPCNAAVLIAIARGNLDLLREHVEYVSWLSRQPYPKPGAEGPSVRKWMATKPEYADLRKNNVKAERPTGSVNDNESPEAEEPRPTKRRTQMVGRIRSLLAKLSA